MFAVWIVGALGLSAITVRVTDWFVMTDELLYERLAISIAHGHSPLPEVRGELIRSLGQLYPLLISPAFAHGAVLDDLRQAHFLNAWIMSSACIPAFLLARRVTGRHWAAYVVAVLTLLTPWLVYAPFLLTEVAAYPAFLWAVLGLQCAVATRRAATTRSLWRGSRSRFSPAPSSCAGVRAAAGDPRAQPSARGCAPAEHAPWQACRTAVMEHRLLAVVYATLGVVALALLAGGRFALELHRVRRPDPREPDPARNAALVHRASGDALARLAVLPFVVGLAWLLANLVRGSANEEWSAFACIGAFAVAILTLEVTTFDLRVGRLRARPLPLLPPAARAARVRVRAARQPPPALVAGASGRPDRVRVCDRRAAGLHLVGSVRAAQHRHADLLVLRAGPPRRPWALERPRAARRRDGRARRALRRLHVAPPASLRDRGARRVRARGHPRGDRVHALAAAPGRRLGEQAADGAANGARLGRRRPRDRAHVAMVPAPITENVFETQQAWRDLEFWNKAVDRDVHYPTANDFRFTGIFFPKTVLGIDDSNGTTDVLPAPYVVQSARETRFRRYQNVMC